MIDLGFPSPQVLSSDLAFADFLATVTVEAACRDLPQLSDVIVERPVMDVHQLQVRRYVELTEEWRSGFLADALAPKRRVRVEPAISPDRQLEIALAVLDAAETAAVGAPSAHGGVFTSSADTGVVEDSQPVRTGFTEYQSDEEGTAA